MFKILVDQLEEFEKETLQCPPPHFLVLVEAFDE
jgi:hypothetical protein